MDSTEHTCHAGGAALAIPEVRENILLFMPLKTILRMQLVCASWAEAIINSPKLRQALLLDPIDKSHGGKVHFVRRSNR